MFRVKSLPPPWHPPVQSNPVGRASMLLEKIDWVPVWSCYFLVTCIPRHFSFFSGLQILHLIQWKISLLSSDLTILQALGLISTCSYPHCPCLGYVGGVWSQTRRNRILGLTSGSLSTLSLLSYLPSVCTLPHPSTPVVNLPGHIQIFYIYCPLLWGLSSASSFKHCQLFSSSFLTS